MDDKRGLGLTLYIGHKMGLEHRWPEVCERDEGWHIRCPLEYLLQQHWVMIVCRDHKL